MKKNQLGLVPVTFLTTVSPYAKGETAGFAPEIAEKLIKEKKAEEYKGETAKK